MLPTSNASLEHTERGMSQLIIPEEVLWNPIISARISRYLSRKDRLNCKNLIPTWDRLTTRILALTPGSLNRKSQLITLLKDATQGVEIFTLDFASHRGKNVIQFLSILSEPGGTGLFNLTTLDIMKQPISIEQLTELLVNCPMPRLRILSLSIVVRKSRPMVTECLKSELKLEEVAIRFFGGLSPYEVLLVMQSFGDLRSMSLDDSSHRRYRLPGRRRDWEHSQVWIPQWTSLQIHHDSELLDLFLGEGKISTGLPELTLLTEPGHFFPKRYITKSSVIPRTVKYRTLKKPQLYIPQFCRACASASDKRGMPRLQCLLTDAVPDDESPLNLVACSVMSVEDNRVLHPLNLHDLYVHVSPPRTSTSTTLPNASASSTISIDRRQTPRRGMVEALIQRRCSEIRHLSIRLCKPTNYECRSKCIQGLPSLAKDYFLPIIEKCGPNLQFLEVSAELITACCSDLLTTRRLRRLQDKCLNVRKATVIASDDMVFEQQFRPSAKNISTYLNLFPSLKTPPSMITTISTHVVLFYAANLYNLTCHINANKCAWEWSTLTGLAESWNNDARLCLGAPSFRKFESRRGPIPKEPGVFLISFARAVNQSVNGARD
ncbi:hypothetical protein SprV_0401513100 [Sparganum proliferum]